MKIRPNTRKKQKKHELKKYTQMHSKKETHAMKTNSKKKKKNMKQKYTQVKNHAMKKKKKRN